MKHHKSFILLFFLLPALLFTGCGSKTATENTGSPLEELESLEDLLVPIKTTIDVEACETLSLDPAEYLIMDEAIDPAKVELHFDSVDPAVCGRYLVWASYEGKAVYFNVQIVDTTAPEIIVKENIPVFSTHAYIRCEDLAEAKDATDAHMSFDADGISWYFSPDKPGEYTLKIVAKDSSDNRNETTVTITVEELAIALDPAAKAQITNDDTLPQIIKDYLLENDTAVIGKDVDFENIHTFSFSSPIPSGQSGTLQDMIQMINSSSHQDYFLTTIKYGILDCGMDKKPDLALQFIFKVGNIDTCVMTTVLHEENGVLTMNFADQDWSRSWSVLYQDGYYASGGSGGASTHYYSYFVLDKSGRAQSLYACEVEGYGYTKLIHGGDPHLDYFGYESADEFTFEDQEELNDLLIGVGACDYTIGKETYNAYSIDSEVSDKEGILHYISLCEENGARFYSVEEIRNLIDKRAASLGFPDWNTGHEEADEVEFHTLFTSQLSEEYEKFVGGYRPDSYSDVTKMMEE